MPAFFQEGRPIQVLRAPGRIDVMGGLGGAEAPLSLSLPTAEAACAAIQGRDDELIRLWSPCRDGSRTQLFSVRLGDLGLPAKPIDYEEARAFLLADPRDRWTGYLMGSLLTLAREYAITPTHGVNLLIHSDVPNRCGVASSSALTVVCLRAFALHYGLELSSEEIARLAGEVEARVMQVDGRISDAMSTILSESGEILALSGSSGDFVGRTVIPSDLEFVGLETGTQSQEMETKRPNEQASQVVRRFQELMGLNPSDDHRKELGELMFQAHGEYVSQGASNDACDLAVEASKARREKGGDIIGAKLTGRGGGGTVLLLGQRGKVWYEALRVKKALNQATGHSGHIFRWSSPGAASFGAIELTPKDS
jgi:galactokinase